MAKTENQKLKLVYLLRIFLEETDEDHMLTMPQVIERLDDYGIHADRKTLYQDFAELNKLDGVEIVATKDGRNTYYFMGERLFELPELKLLVDSVQAAKFITDRKSDILIHKLERLVSKYEAKQLQRQVLITGRVKTPNKAIYYNVDKIYTAIGSNRQITFHYFQWNVKKEQVLRHDGALYHVSPWCLVWDDEYYYLVGYEAASEGVRHYRVDKMKDLAVVDKPREGLSLMEEFDTAKYTKSLVGMYGGEKTTVTVEAANNLAGVFIDRFGQDIWIRPLDSEHFTAHLDVVPSRQFLGWIFALGDSVKITAPESVVGEMRAAAQALGEKYGG